MDVQTIVMPKEEAKVKLQAYRKRLAKMKIGKANEDIAREYKAALQGYEALAEGAVLLDIDDVFTNCPIDEKARPKLAFARADRKQVRVVVGREFYRFIATRDMHSWNAGPAGLDITITPNRKVESGNGGYSIIPMVPADKKPIGQLKDFFILWEVEAWADESIKATPDIDPYLLKHLGGSLYAVVAEWDLTDLERSIMKGRRN